MSLASTLKVNLTCAGCARFNTCRQSLRGPASAACGDYSPALHSFANGAPAPSELFEVLGLLASAQQSLSDDSRVMRRDNVYQYIAAVCAQAAAANQKLANTPFQVFNYYYVQYRGADVDYLSNWAKMLLVGVTLLPAVGKSHAGYALEFVALEAAPVIRSMRMVWHQPGESNRYFIRFPVMPERIIPEAEWPEYAQGLFDDGLLIDPAIDQHAEATARRVQSELLAARDGGKQMPDTASRFLASIGEFDPGSALDYPPDTSDTALTIDDTGEIAPEGRDLSQYPIIDLPTNVAIKNALLSIFPRHFFISSTGDDASAVVVNGEVVDVDACGMYLVPLEDCHLDHDHGVVVGGQWEQLSYTPDSYVFYPSEVLDGTAHAWLPAAKLDTGLQKVIRALADSADSALPPDDVDSLRDEVARGVQ